MLKKELRDENLQALLGGSSFRVSSNVEPDPLLSLFIYNPPGQPVSKQPQSSIEASLVKETLKEELLERYRLLTFINASILSFAEDNRISIFK